jgi:predicted GIY-YIG superfamily endonuclease
VSVYVLHFCAPIAHARHYTGFAVRVADRIDHHRAGRGARLTQVARERGVDFVVGVIFRGPRYDRAFERRLKNAGHAERVCRICQRMGGNLEVDEQ